ncbi:Tetratricopeptide-like helical domain superfamily [Sesbania bispinosa]|nr:Tetratricopeptide-like helical domain superfamily [Sesbania bispinosa]
MKAFCLHGAVLKKGSQSHVIISNQVLNMYAKCVHVSIAREVFDEMFERNIVSWSAMISGYDQCGEHWMALHLFSQMKLLPNEYIFASALSACASLKALMQGKQIHARSLTSGLHGNMVTGEGMAKQLLEVPVVTTSSHVLLSNLYASDGMWSNVTNARKMLKGGGLRKEPG